MKTSKILIVDDDQNFCNFLKNVLKEENFVIFFANDGDEGYKIANTEVPDLVITDVMMPKMNGFEMIRKLKSNNLTANLNYFILTNYGDSNATYDVNFLDVLGIKKYLIKSNHSPKEIANEIKLALVY